MKFIRVIKAKKMKYWETAEEVMNKIYKNLEKEGYKNWLAEEWNEFRFENAKEDVVLRVWFYNGDYYNGLENKVTFILYVPNNTSYKKLNRPYVTTIDKAIHIENITNKIKAINFDYIDNNKNIKAGNKQITFRFPVVTNVQEVEELLQGYDLTYKFEDAEGPYPSLIVTGNKQEIIRFAKEVMIGDWENDEDAKEFVDKFIPELNKLINSKNIKASNINIDDKNTIDQIIHCTDLNQICNMIGKTSDDVRAIKYRKLYDFPDTVSYCKNEDLLEKCGCKLLTNRIISNIDKSIKNWGEYKLSLPKNKRHIDYVNFKDNYIDIKSWGGGFYKIFFHDPIRTKHEIKFY